ncbi:MAG: lysine--tRNA ligase [Hydrotalea sp. AMD]|uniref:lysine--tRNA ligase n=1 Tax=Hydrotalea sp. AMD TaxID=2501297 RepID=UPI00094472F0|nr:lysine--tRNA ligase [Hydrotalea sp. AMD]RWZ87403.1 MAG: lysine--tRNA ligase [Hydrotalea sp. AMD]
MSVQLSEQELIRREKLAKLKAAGIEPYPAALYPVTHYSSDIKVNFSEENKDNFQNVCVAGRIMSINDKGKVFFIKIQDSKGIFQLYVKRDDICPGEDKSFWDDVIKHGLDLGDIIGATGFVFITKTGETSLHTQTITLLTKSLKPLPVVKRDDEGNVYDEVTDPEFRYRQRYVDLIINPSVKENFVQRTQLINTIRTFLNEKGALEVDTPVLQPIPGGAAAKPFITHHNALDIPLYLRIANELYLKRLIVGGFDWVYEFSRNFRNEGMDRTHNPEFTVLEWYTAYKDYFWMMEITEQLVEKIALALHGTTEVQVGETIINFKAPYKRISIFEAIQENTGIDISQMDEAGLRAVCQQLHIDVPGNIGKGKLIDEIFGATSEHKYIQPAFIIDYPVEMSPLTKKHRSKAGLVERFELMVNGKEIANAYSELNDPIDQRERFEEQLQLMQRGDEEAMYIDYDFLRALEYGMPPTSGIGIGIDRLCMLMTNQPSIQDVLLFPQMRPEKL